jgi:hypothetical protein
MNASTFTVAWFACEWGKEIETVELLPRAQDQPMLHLPIELQMPVQQLLGAALQSLPVGIQLPISGCGCVTTVSVHWAV